MFQKIHNKLIQTVPNEYDKEIPKDIYILYIKKKSIDDQRSKIKIIA